MTDSKPDWWRFEHYLTNKYLPITWSNPNNSAQDLFGVAVSQIRTDWNLEIFSTNGSYFKIEFVFLRPDFGVISLIKTLLYQKLLELF